MAVLRREGIVGFASVVLSGAALLAVLWALTPHPRSYVVREDPAAARIATTSGPEVAQAPWGLSRR